MRRRGGVARAAEHSAPHRTNAQPTPDCTGAQRFHANVARVLWALILAPPLLALLTLAALTLTHTPARVDTGDALLDAYLQAVVEHEIVSANTTYLSPSYYLPDSAKLTADEWSELEHGFHTDPRFWVLCEAGDRKPQSPDAAPRYFSTVAQTELLYDCKYLEQARVRGCVDTTLLIRLFAAYRTAWWSDTREMLKLSPPDKKAQVSEWIAYSRLIIREVDAMHRTTDDRLLDELEALAPATPLVRYIRAADAAQRGNVGLARSLTLKGNKLAQAPGGLTDGVWRWQRRIIACDPLLIDFLPGTVESLYRKPLHPLYRGNSTSISFVIGLEVPRHLQLSHDMACAVALAADCAPGVEIHIQSALEQLALVAPRAHGKSLTGEQAHALQQLQDVLAEIKSLSRQQQKQEIDSEIKLLEPTSVPSRLARILAGKQHGELLLLRVGAYRESSRQSCADRQSQLYRELLRFDYTTLSWRDVP